MSNYPPGVTGNEYQINGPDYDKETDAPCWYCGNTENNLEFGYQRQAWIDCGKCGKQTDIDTDDFGDRADYYYQRMKDGE